MFLKNIPCMMKNHEASMTRSKWSLHFFPSTKISCHKLRQETIARDTMQEQKYDDESTSDPVMAGSKKEMSSPARQNTRSMLKRSGEQDRKEVEHALAWLYSRDQTIKDAKYFQKLNTIIPVVAHNTYEDRAQDLAETLTWMRSRRREREDASIDQSCRSTLTH